MNSIIHIIRSGFLSLFLIWAFPAHAQSPQPQPGEEIIQRLKEMLPQVNPEAVPRDAIRELKQEGDTYVSRATVQITAKVSSSRLNNLFNTEVSHIRYVGDVRFHETVLAVTTNGVIETELFFMGIDSRLEAARTQLSFYDHSTAPLVRFTADYREKLEKGGYALVALLASSGQAIKASIVGFLTRHFSRKADELVAKGYRVLENGEILIPAAELRKKIPEVGAVVGAIERTTERCEGSRIRTTWEWGKGYTSIKVLDPVRGKMAESDKELIGKLVYRTSMVSAGIICPKSRLLEVGDTWTIDAGALGGMLATGVEFDYLEGTLHAERGATELWDSKKMSDEAALVGRQNFAVTRIILDPTIDSIVRGKVRKPDAGADAVSFSIKPSGSFWVVTDENIPSQYVREAKLQSSVGTLQEQYRDSLLRKMRITGNGQIQITFEQNRVHRAQ